jgi:hypothetical protein
MDIIVNAREIPKLKMAFTPDFLVISRGYNAGCTVEVGARCRSLQFRETALLTNLGWLVGRKANISANAESQR